VEKCGTQQTFLMTRNTATIAEGQASSYAPMRACSACAGDYEDPERSAWSADPEDDQDNDELEGGAPGENSANHAERRGVSCEMSSASREGGEADAEEKAG
jgi:hypothetical protein